MMFAKRTKPGQEPHWSAPGGAIEDTDDSFVDSLHRELSEELGASAVVADASRVFLVSSPSDGAVAVQHFFVARPSGLDEAARSGPEFDDPLRGQYELDQVDLHGDNLASID